MAKLCVVFDVFSYSLALLLSCSADLGHYLKPRTLPNQGRQYGSLDIVMVASLPRFNSGTAVGMFDGKVVCGV